MMRIFYLCLGLLLSGLTLAANTVKPGLNLPGNLAKILHWTPVPARHGYQTELQEPDKIADFQKLGYGMVTLNQTHQLNIKSDAQIEETISTSQLFLNNSGIENAGNSGFWFDITTQQAEILEAYVLQADGKRIDVRPDTLQINTDNSPNIFNDYYYVTIPFAQLQPGSIAILVYKTTTYRKKSPLPWARNFYPANFNHIEHFQIEVDWANEALKPAWQTDYAPLECRETPLKLRCDSKTAATPLPTDRGMPSVYDVLPVFTLAEPGSWVKIDDTMQKLTESSLSASGKVTELAAQLVDGVNSPQEKMNKLAGFVSREIRYVGLEHGHGGVRPKATLSTLEQRFGDCKDKTMLFVDLARKSGLDAYPVLTSTNRFSLSKLLLPTSIYFNHMIACANLDSGKPSCVDLTDPYTSPELLPKTIQGAVSLPIGRGSPVPDKLQSEEYPWALTLKSENRLTKNGSVEENLVRTYQTHWAAGLRGSLASKSQADRERWLLDNYHTVMSDKVTPSMQVTGLEHTQSPIVISSTTQFSNAFNPEKIEVYAEPELWLKSFINSYKIQNTYYPYAFNGFNYQSQISYQLYPERNISNLGPKLDYDTPWGSFHRYYRTHDDTVQIFTELKMPSASIPVNKLAEFNRFMELIKEESRIWFSLEPLSRE